MASAIRDKSGRTTSQRMRSKSGLIAAAIYFLASV
jgi:hypothetical protein